ncbi:MAG: LON peptidase substrate-binding domain-containing protein, partial [Deltaproteobacteria bacterium]|nr:LON peptidase substrate-binding domain-containing protein [Deltaproteobacteria bacterium]
MIQIPKFFNQDDSKVGRVNYPLLPLRDIVVFPHMVAPLFVGRKKSVNALTEAMNRDKTVFLATQKKASIDNPSETDISRVGTIGTILQLLRLPDGTVKALVEGKSRAKIKSFIQNVSFFQVEVEPVVERRLTEAQAIALKRAVLEHFEEYAKLNKNISKELISNVSAINDPSQLADTVAAHFSFKIGDKQKLLETIDLEERLSFLLSLIAMEIDIYKMDQRIRGRVKEQMEKTQKNYYLNEQMRAIKKEMGADDDAMEDLNELEKRIEEKKMSKEAEEKVRAEFKKLKMMTPMSAEATVVRNYIEWILSLPWTEKSEIQTDQEAAEKILDEDHFGLE